MNNYQISTGFQNRTRIVSRSLMPSQKASRWGSARKQKTTSKTNSEKIIQSVTSDDGLNSDDEPPGNISQFRENLNYVAENLSNSCSGLIKYHSQKSLYFNTNIFKYFSMPTSNIRGVFLKLRSEFFLKQLKDEQRNKKPGMVDFPTYGKHIK